MDLCLTRRRDDADTVVTAPNFHQCGLGFGSPPRRQKWVEFAFSSLLCCEGSLLCEQARGKLWRQSHHCARKSDLPETPTSKPARRLLRQVFSPGTPVLPSPQKPTFQLSLRSGKCVELVGDALTGQKVYLTLELSSANLSEITLL